VKWGILGILAMLIPFAADAQVTFSQLAEITTSPERLEGRFRQDKYLAALDATLMSTGVFSYQRGKLIRWEILEPIRNILELTPTAMTTMQADGEILRLDSASNSNAAVLGRIFFSVLTAEWESLSNYFELTGEIEGRQWHAVLVPIDAAVMQVFSLIELTGGDLLQEVILHEKSGDRTTIRLDSHR